MFDGGSPASLQYVERTNEIRVDIGPRILDAVPNPSLRREMKHHLRPSLSNQLLETVIFFKQELM